MHSAGILCYKGFCVKRETGSEAAAEAMRGACLFHRWLEVAEPVLVSLMRESWARGKSLCPPPQSWYCATEKS